MANYVQVHSNFGPYFMQDKYSITLPAWTEKTGFDPTQVPFWKDSSAYAQLLGGIAPEGDPETFSPKVRKIELTHCRQDPIYFIENYCFIHDPRFSLAKFKLEDYHSYKLLPTMISRRGFVLPKFRQGVFSRLYAAYLIWEAIRERDLYVVCLADSVRNNIIMEAWKEIWSSLPTWLQPKVTQLNQSLIQTETLQLRYLSPKPREKFIPDILILDEIAHIPNFEWTWNNLYSMIGLNTKCWITSTPNGTNNWFYRAYQQVLNGDFLDLDLLRVHYTENSRYANPEWAERMKKAIGPEKFRSDILAEF